MTPEAFDAEWSARLASIAMRAMHGSDPAHDEAHVRRVTANARFLAEKEGGSVHIAVPAALLHELFNYPKDHPESHRSGELCAVRATAVLHEVSYPTAWIEPVAYCIRVHGFARGIVPETLEAKVLQDADRLDAIGAIGIARLFATCASMGRPFYRSDDPFCETREPDDRQWGVDHFYRKLLRIHESLHTPTARALGAERMTFMQTYLAQLRSEITPGE